MISIAKKILKPQLLRVHSVLDRRFNSDVSNEALLWHVYRGAHAAADFNFDCFREHVLEFVASQNCGEVWEYKYSDTATTPNLYCSVYAFLTFSLFGELKRFSTTELNGWKHYFDSFQDTRDGLFRDCSLNNDVFEDCDWWGCRHLTLHVLTAYDKMGQRPQNDLSYLERFYGPGVMRRWLESLEWSMDADIDNKLMNIGAMLQFSAKEFDSREANNALRELIEWLQQKICPETGMWGGRSWPSDAARSRAVQFAYHLYPILLYDGMEIEHRAFLIDNVLRTQNAIGGFAPHLNSSACEDIDSIYLLLKANQFTGGCTEKVGSAAKRYFSWVLGNQNTDGGFVFRRGLSFTYRHEQMSSGVDESHMFATWFRCLSIVYARRLLGFENEGSLGTCVGFELA